MYKLIWIFCPVHFTLLLMKSYNKSSHKVQYEIHLMCGDAER